MDPQPRNLAQLATALESAWLNIPENTFRDLSDSLPLRLAVVRSAKGGYYGLLPDGITNVCVSSGSYAAILCMQKTDGSVIFGSSAPRAEKSVSECRVMEVTLVDQRSYSKTAVLREKNAMEYHSELVEALGNNVLPYRTAARWVY
ncbi:transposable element Tcb1 transposase [Trichonephila clavipes]|nr:transposable element Tcb1 transposase [Trichonephila clavipes]